MAQIASVAAITGTGKAFAVNEQGVSRELKAGDVLQKGETIRTVGDVRVELLMDDGRLMAVAPNQVLRLDENVSESDQRPTAQDSAIGAPAATADTILQALERGTDLSTELEATAAGLGGAGGADGGSSFVQLLRIVEGVDPLAYEYAYTAPDLLPDLQSDPLVEVPEEPAVSVGVTVGTGIGVGGDGSGLITGDIIKGTVSTVDVVEGSGGGTRAVTFLVTLDKVSSTDVTVTYTIVPGSASRPDDFNDGAITGTITIPAGYIGFSLTENIVEDTLVEGNETFTIVLSNPVGATLVNDTATVTIIDDDLATVSLSVSPADITEAGSEVTYTATLTGSTFSTDVTVTLSNGQVITIAAGQTSGNVSFTFVPSDDVYVDPSSVGVVIDSVDAGAFTNKLTVDGTPATVSISDTLDEVTVSIASKGDVNETQAAVFTVSVSEALDRDLTVTLSNEATVTIVAGSTSAEYSVPAQGDDVYQDGDSITLSVLGASVEGAEFEDLVISEAAATVTIDDTTTPVSATLTSELVGDEDGATVTYTMTLGTAPTSAETFTFMVGDAQKTITVNAESTTGTTTVSFSEPDVFVDTDTIPAPTGLTSSNNSNYEQLNLVNNGTSHDVLDTIDTTTVTIDRVDGSGNVLTGSVPEGSQITLRFSVDHAPQGALTLQTSVGEVVIANGTTYTDVTMAAPEVSDGDGSLTVSISSFAGGNYESLVTTDTAVVPIIDSVPTGGSVSATVDDDGLAGGIAGGVGDYVVTNADGDNNEATFGGTLIHNFGGDSAGASINFALMNGSSGPVGTETVTYGWDGDTNTLTAKVTGGARDGTPLFTVLVNPTSGVYKVTLLDNVLHASGNNENDAGPVALTYTVVDGDASTATGTLNVTFNDDTPTFTQIMQGIAANQVGVLSGTHNIAFGADGEGSISLSGLTSVVGLNYSTAIHNPDGSTTITAGTGTSTTGFFALTVKADGTYDFDLIDPRPSTSKTVSSFGVQGAPAVPSLTIGTGTEAITFTGLGGDTIKPTSAGFGINDGNVDPGDEFSVAFAGNQVDSVSFQVKSQGSGALTLNWSTATESGSVSITANGAVVIDPLNDFTSITFSATGGNAASAKVESFSYSQNLLPPDQVLQFNVSATDADGDVTATQVLGIQLLGGAVGASITGTGADESILGTSAGETISGGAGHDIINAGAGNDTLIGGGGSDTLWGNAGSDTFVWKLADAGVAGAVPVDAVKDFGTGDKLDFSDLLQNHTTGDLTPYLNIAYSNGTDTTTINVSTLGNGTFDQVIQVNGDLTGGFSTQADIIASMISTGKIIPDA